jgi:hypothetical protein
MASAMTRIPVTLIALIAAAAAPAFAAPAPDRPATHRAEQASIPFAGLRIRNFHAEADDVVYLEDRSRNWYRAELIGPCREIRWARGIGIDTRGSGSFDRFSALLVDGQRCQLASLTRSARPERRKAKRRT